MLNSKIALVGVTALGLTSAIESRAVAQSWKPVVLEVLSPDLEDTARTRDGRLRKTDEEFTNEQGVVKFFANGTRGLYVEMRTGALSTGERPVHRMQGACVPIELAQDGTGAVSMVKRTGEKFISDNDGNEYRNFNKPELMPINNGKNMLVMFNYQPEGTSDTRRYVKVLDENCNEVPVRNRDGELRKQIVVMAKNNDDCDMHQSGEGPCDIASDAGGTTHLVCWAGCNGNGRDDGWLNDLTVDCQTGPDGGATDCTVRKNFDISLARREERSRGRCSLADEDPSTAICTWTEGNTQPQRDGTWIAAVDVSSGGEEGPNAESRLLWKEQLDGRNPISGDDERDTYSVRAMHTRLLEARPDGTLGKSNMIFFRSGNLRGRNRNNEKGGTYRSFNFSVIRATRTGMEYVVPNSDPGDMLLGIDGTHLTMCGAVFGGGTDMMPGFTLLQGSHNGGGASEPVVKAIGYDVANRKFVDLGAHRTGGNYDRHLYSNYLGNNPGNQGRNFAGCSLVKNPFAGQNGSTTEYFIAHALTGKSPELTDRPEIKPSSFVTLLPVKSTVSSQRSMLTSAASGSAAEPQGASGCTTSGGSGGTSTLLLMTAVGLFLSARRRRV